MVSITFTSSLNADGGASLELSFVIITEEELLVTVHHSGRLLIFKHHQHTQANDEASGNFIQKTIPNLIPF